MTIEQEVASFHNPFNQNLLKIHKVLIDAAMFVSYPFRWCLEQMNDTPMFRAELAKMEAAEKK